MIKVLVISSSLLIPIHEAPTGWQYGADCCAMNDCFQEQPNNVREYNTGYFIVSAHETIPYGDKRIRTSQDGYFHRCTLLGNEDAPTSICLYVPPRSF